jgi:hypothetical protein
MDNITVDEWIAKSKKGEICGMGDAQILRSQCLNCGNHWCYDHFKIHGHVVTPEEQSSQNRRDKSLDRLSLHLF